MNQVNNKKRNSILKRLLKAKVIIFGGYMLKTTKMLLNNFIKTLFFIPLFFNINLFSYNSNNYEYDKFVIENNPNHQASQNPYPPLPYHWSAPLNNVVANNDEHYDPFELLATAPGFLMGEVKRKDLNKTLFTYNKQAESKVVDIIETARNQNKMLIIKRNCDEIPTIRSEKQASELLVIGENISNNWSEINFKQIKIVNGFFRKVFIDYTSAGIRIRKELTNNYFIENISKTIKNAKKERKNIYINNAVLNCPIRQKYLRDEQIIKILY